MPGQGSWGLNQSSEKKRGGRKSEAQTLDAGLVKGQGHTCMLRHINSFEISPL